MDIEQILRWNAMNVEQNEGCFINIYQEADLWLESKGTKGSMPPPIFKGDQI